MTLRRRKETRAVEFDTFDEKSWQGVSNSKLLTDAMFRLELEDNSFVEDLYADTFQLLMVSEPDIQNEMVMRLDRLINHAFASITNALPDTEALRFQIDHDEYLASLALASMEEYIKEMLERLKNLQEELAKQQEAAEAAGGEEDPDGEDAASAGEDGLPDSAAAMIKALADKAVKKGKEAVAEEQSNSNSWSTDPGSFKRMSFTEREKMSKCFNSSKFKMVSQMLGRFDFISRGEYAKSKAREDIVGITVGGNVEDIIPSEMALSRHHRGLRLDFLRRVSESQVLIHEFEGLNEVGKGPIICMIDSSGSMSGEREAWSKALSIALLRHGRRDCTFILFSHRKEDLRVYEFPAGKQDMNEIVKFVESFISGGTAFEDPIDLAIEKLAGKPNADLVLVTDGQAPLNDKWLDSYKERKRQLGFRMWGFDCSGSKNPALDILSDKVYSIGDLADPSQATELFAATA